MCGVGNLTRAAYANQRMTLVGNRQISVIKRSTMTALRGAIHSGVFSSFMFYDGRLAMPPTDVSVWRHATSFAAKRCLKELGGERELYMRCKNGLTKMP